MKRPTLFAACPMKLQVDDKPYAFLVGAKLQMPLEIGCDVRSCPKCGQPMSYGNNHYFCRKCIYVEY